MSTTVADFIRRAYIRSNIISPEYESADSQQLSDGLMLLNECMSEIGINSSANPYETTFSFDTVPGQTSYILDNYIENEVVSFRWGEVRYQLEKVGAAEFLGTTRVMNVTSLPFQYYIRRIYPNSMEIQIYYSPANIYTVEVTGKRPLNTISITDPADLETLFDSFYLLYLNICLAKAICDWTGITEPPANEERRLILTDKISRINGPDMTLNSSGSNSRAINYPLVNFSGRWG